jgi:sugar O-acyltransferase (sialic acid O-acetyltransferase NeuD family)
MLPCHGLRGQKKRVLMKKSDAIKVVILGAGGHAQVAAEIIISSVKDSMSFDLVGFLDDDPSQTNKVIMGKPVLGLTSKLDQLPHDGIFIAIGHNPTRAKLFDQFNGQKEKLVNLVHHSAIIASDVILGCGVMVAPGAIINTGSVIGNNVIINTRATIDHHNSIEDHVHIAPGVHLGGGVNIQKGSLVGIGSTVIPQRRVGAWSLVGAGSVVIKDVGDGVVAAGVPARIIRKLK